MRNDELGTACVVTAQLRMNINLIYTKSEGVLVENCLRGYSTSIRRIRTLFYPFVGQSYEALICRLHSLRLPS
jgi:hypothetical protein